MTADIKVSSDNNEQPNQDMVTLKARVTRLEESIKDVADYIGRRHATPMSMVIIDLLKPALNEAAEQSLAEHNKQVIEDHCGNAFLIPPYMLAAIQADAIEEAVNWYDGTYEYSAQVLMSRGLLEYASDKRRGAKDGI